MELSRDSSAVVLHDEFVEIVVFTNSDADARIRSVGVLDRVAHEIEEDLLEREALRLQCRHTRCDIDRHLRGHTQHFNDILQQVFDAHAFNSIPKSARPRIFQQAIDERAHPMDARSKQRQMLLALGPKPRPEIFLNPGGEARDPSQRRF